MLQILELLDKSAIIQKYNIIDYKQGESFYYFKIRSILCNNTFLDMRIYVSSEEYNYSYHWQDSKGELIVRWDNAPHHNGISTFPHHKHISDRIEPSQEIELKDIIKYIENRIW